MSGSGAPQREPVLACCRAFAGAELTHPFGEDTAVYKVAGKIFALVSLGDPPGSVSLKCEPEIGVRHREHPAVSPGYHLNKRHWITVALDAGVALRELEEMVEDSYDLVVESLSKARRVTIAAGGR